MGPVACAAASGDIGMILGRQGDKGSWEFLGSGQCWRARGLVWLPACPVVAGWKLGVQLKVGSPDARDWL